jgi:muramidase (phage lysozyme)
MAFSDRAMEAIGAESAPKDYERYLKDENVQGFLSGIHKHEGYPAENETVGYKQFKDLSEHPNIPVKFNSGGATSTAAGKYQIIKSTWDDQKKKQGLKDFTEENQKLAAIGLLDESGALDAIKRGDTEKAIQLAGKHWAGLPGSTIGVPTGQKSKPFTPESVKDFAPQDLSTFSARAKSASEENQIRKETQASIEEKPKDRSLGELAGEFGKSTVSLLNNTVGAVIPTAVNLLTYPVAKVGEEAARLAGFDVRKDFAKDITNQATEAFSRPFGKAFGIDQNDKMVQNEASSRIMRFIGENIGEGAQALSDKFYEKTGQRVDPATFEWMANTGMVAAGGKVGEVGKNVGKTLQEQFAAKNEMPIDRSREPVFDSTQKPTLDEQFKELKGVGAAKAEGNPYEPFVNQETARGGDFPVVKLSNGSNDVPLTEQQTRAQIAQEILQSDKVRTGVMTGNESTLRNEVMLAKKAGETPQGQLMKDQLAEEQRALSSYAQQRIEATGADPVLKNDYERGERVNETFAGKENSLSGFINQEKNKLYEEARNQVGDKPIQTTNVNEVLNDPQFKAGLGLKGNENVANSAGQLIELARTVGFKDEHGNVYAPNSIGAWDAVRKALNANWTKDNAGVIKVINRAIDQDIAAAGGGDLLKRADALHRAEKVLFESAGIKKVFGDIDPNGVQTAVPFEKIMQTLNSMPFDQWRHIYNTAEMLERGTIRGEGFELPVPPELQQAATSVLAEMKGSIAREVYEDGAKNAGVWSHQAANKVMNARAKKIEYAFDPEEVAKFHTLNYGGQIMPGGHGYEGAALQGERLQGITARLGGLARTTAKATAEGLPVVGAGVRIFNEANAQKSIIKAQQRAATAELQRMKQNAQSGKTKLSDFGKK